MNTKEMNHTADDVAEIIHLFQRLDRPMKHAQRVAIMAAVDRAFGKRHAGLMYLAIGQTGDLSQVGGAMALLEEILPGNVAQVYSSFDLQDVKQWSCDVTLSELGIKGHGEHSTIAGAVVLAVLRLLEAEAKQRRRRELQKVLQVA